MKGISYLTNDTGKKTHIVLDLDVWGDMWQKLLELEEEYLLTAGIAGLKQDIESLESDLPKADVDHWLAAFKA
jgi:hypothetical protein